MSDKQELKPCPFCGGKPTVECYKDLYGNKEPFSYKFNHTCKNHQPQHHSHSFGYETRAKAIEAWNRRV